MTQNLSSRLFYHGKVRISDTQDIMFVLAQNERKSANFFYLFIAVTCQHSLSLALIPSSSSSSLKSFLSSPRSFFVHPEISDWMWEKKKIRSHQEFWWREGSRSQGSKDRLEWMTGGCLNSPPFSISAIMKAQAGFLRLAIWNSLVYDLLLLFQIFQIKAVTWSIAFDREVREQGLLTVLVL